MLAHHLSLRCVILSALWTTCLAWGNLGHRTVALLAEKHLSPSSKAYAQSLLGTYEISDAAIWADDYKNTPDGKHTGSWHFVDANDHPPTYCNISITRDCKPSRPCIIYALNDVNNILLDSSRTWNEHHQAFLFLIHLFGDLHHPLHVESVARGGNDIDVLFEGQHLSLHFIWDVSMPHRMNGGAMAPERSAAEAWAQRLFHRAVHHADTRSQHYVGGMQPQEVCLHLDAIDTFLAWARESNRLNCEYVLHDGIEQVKGKELSGSYFDWAVPIIDELISQAGWRLANWIEALAEKTRG